MCVRDTRTRFLLRHPQTCFDCWGHRGSGYSGVDVTRFAYDRELSVHFCFFLRRRPPFLIIVPIDFWFLPNLIHYCPTFEFKPIIILSCSSNMVAEGIGGQTSDIVARRRWATLLVYYKTQTHTFTVFKQYCSTTTYGHTSHH